MLIMLCVTSFALEILVPRLIMNPIAQVESPQALSLLALSHATSNTRLVTFGPMQAVSWYTGRRVLVTDKPDELEFGSKQGDHSAWFPDQQALLGMWGGSDHVLIFLKKRELERMLPKMKPSPRILGESGRQVLVGNR